MISFLTETNSRQVQYQWQNVAFHAKGLCRGEGRKEILLMRATTKVDGHVNVLSEQINGPQLYRGKL